MYPYSTNGQLNLGVNAIMNERSWTSKDSVNAKYVDANNLVMQIATSNNEILEITLQKLAKTTFSINQTSPNSAIYFSQNPKSVFSSKGSINSTGIVEITGIDTANMLISGKFILSVHNPLTKEERTFRAGSFKNIKLEYVASNYSQKSSLIANIDGVSWTSPYVYAYENMNNKVQIIATDGFGMPRMRLSVPKDTVNGVNELEAFYYDNSGKIYISQESQVTNIEQDTTFRIIRGSFNFKSINSIDGVIVNV